MRRVVNERVASCGVHTDPCENEGSHEKYISRRQRSGGGWWSRGGGDRREGWWGRGEGWTLGWEWGSGGKGYSLS